jgi:hypothetical protein
MPAIDFGREEILPGMKVAYPVRRGSEMWLRFLTVSHIETIRAAEPVFHVVGTNDTGRPVKLEHPDRCVIMRG